MAQAFALEVNTILGALRGFVDENKVPVPPACAAMLIFCRNCAPEGHATRHALETVLRKNFPFLKLEAAPAVKQ
jgi:hypothetical protein